MAQPAPQLKGLLTLKVNRATDLPSCRLIGTMDPYVKITSSGDKPEKFKTKVSKNGGTHPVWEQAFLFNLDGTQDQIHFAVYDDEMLKDTYVGRADLTVLDLLSAAGPQFYPLVDPDNFRKAAGSLEVLATFEGTGLPQNLVQKDANPIDGPCHIQHNSTGFLLHASGNDIGSYLYLGPGGLNDWNCAFEFQGAYIKHCASSLYIHPAGGADGHGQTLNLLQGIGDPARFKWTGLGLQHVSSSQVVHPKDDKLEAGVRAVLFTGSNAASGFTLIKSTASHAPAASAAPAAPAARTNNNNNNASAGGGPFFDRLAATAPVAAAVGDIPNSIQINTHTHPLFVLNSIYAGKYNCDLCGKEGTGKVYHCEPCKFDAHIMCAKQHQKK